MELSKFIEDTLTGIHTGIKNTNLKYNNDIFRMNMNDEIKFDVAVTVFNEAGKESGGKISVFSVGLLGGSVDETRKNESISRIKFEVKVVHNSFGYTVDSDRK